MDNGNQALTVHTVRELWSKIYNTNGKPSWSHIFSYYHPNIVFRILFRGWKGSRILKPCAVGLAIVANSCRWICSRLCRMVIQS